jgi:Alginate lyase
MGTFVIRYRWAGLFILVASIGFSTGASADVPPRILAQITSQFEFRHPGALNNLAELYRIRDKIAAGDEPWKSAFEKMQQSPYARRDYAAHPISVVGKGPTEANEVRDAVAAYTQVLLWVFTHDEWHAEKAAQLLDAWSSTALSFEGLNWYLDPAWASVPLVEAGEILRATYPAWQGAPRLARQFNDLFLPILHNRLALGNRELAVCNALVAIGVFNDDRAAFYEGINHWLSYVPSYFYIKEDGAEPRRTNYFETSPSDQFLEQLDAHHRPAGWTSWMQLAQSLKNQGDDRTWVVKPADELWKHPGAYLPGYTPETGGRDLAHTESAFVSAVNVAEIAWHQGIDIYSFAAPRLAVFMETMAAIRLGDPISTAAYGGKLDLGNGLTPTYEVAYNHLHNVLGIDLPRTRELIETVIRHTGPVIIDPPFPAPIPASVRANRIWQQAGWTANWETLTHGELDHR